MRQPEVTHALANAAATRALGQRFARVLRDDKHGPTYIALTGELGSGKTTLVAGILAALGQQGPIRSPTYTLVEPYEFDGRELLHCDLYRLESPDALDELGLRDVLTAANVLLVEWPERAGGRLGPPDLRLTLSYDGPGRRAVLAAGTPRGVVLITELALDRES